MFEVWQTPQLLKLIDERNGCLLHENDGLIFTVDACPYYPGSCAEIRKWKPVHMNTIDFGFKLLGKVGGQSLFGLTVMQRQNSTTPFFDFFVLDEKRGDQLQFKHKLEAADAKSELVFECAYDPESKVPLLCLLKKLLRVDCGNDLAFLCQDTL